MGVGMGGDQRRVRDRRDIVKAFAIQVAEVDHDLQPVAFADQPFARLGQPRPGIGVGGVAERDAMAEKRGSRPDRAK